VIEAADVREVRYRRLPAHLMVIFVVSCWLFMRSGYGLVMSTYLPIPGLPPSSTRKRPPVTLKTLRGFAGDGIPRHVILEREFDPYRRSYGGLARSGSISPA